MIKFSKWFFFIAACVLMIFLGESAINRIIFLMLLAIFIELLDIHDELKK